MSTETTKYKYENSGPWDSEPDRVEWVDEATGLACLIIRTEHSGALCGYVGLPQGHSLHGIEYGNINVRVHGGLTYSAIGDGEFRPAGFWWVGFDCCHCWDAYPAQRHGWRDANATYKDIDYVRSETAKLAAQLVNYTTEPTI